MLQRLVLNEIWIRHYPSKDTSQTWASTRRTKIIGPHLVLTYPEDLIWRCLSASASLIRFSWTRKVKSNKDTSCRAAAIANSSKKDLKSSQTSIKRTMTSLSKTATLARSHRREIIHLPSPTNTPHLSKKETKLLHDSHRSLCRRNLLQPWKWIRCRMNIVKIGRRAPA